MQSRNWSRTPAGWAFMALLTLVAVLPVSAQSKPTVYSATLGESEAKTPEISTDELRRVLADKTATLFDVRPALEYSISHIPGAVNVAQKSGSSKALYVSDVAEIGRLLGGDKTKAAIVYCNGPFCGKSKRISDELVAAGYANVKRYQLGIPVWRALGGVTQIESEGVAYVMQKDQSAVWLDTRPAEQAVKAAFPGARRIGVDVTVGGKDNPAMQRAKNEGTLPMDDHNTRIIIFGDDPQVVRKVAEAVAKEAFHNVSFFAGSAADLRRSLK